MICEVFFLAKSNELPNDKQQKKFRRIDELGRVVPPVEFRSMLHILPGDELAFWVNGQTIVMQKAESSCVFCGNKNDLLAHKDAYICKDCFTDIVKSYK